MRQARFMLLLGFACYALFKLSLTSIAMVGIQPSIATLDGTPGMKRQFVMQVSNGAPDGLNLTTEVKHFAMTTAGVPFGASEEGLRSAAHWISCPSPKFTLQPGKSQPVSCTLAVPPGTTGGGYYAVISVTGVLNDTERNTANGASIRFAYQANAVILVTVPRGKLESAIVVRKIELSSRRQQTGPVKWSVSVLAENTGNIHTLAIGDGEVREATSGRVIWRGPLLAGKGIVIPGYPRYFQADLPSELGDGAYVVGASVRLSGGRQAIRAAQTFRVIKEVAEPVAGDSLLTARTGDLELSQSQVALNGVPGSRRSSTFTVKNISMREISCQLSLAGLQISSEGNPVPCDPTSVKDSAVTWIQFAPISFTLAPGKATTVRVSASLPLEAKGEQFALIIITPQTTSGPNLLPMSVLVSILAEGTIRPVVKVFGLEITPSKEAGLLLKAQVCNEGNARLFPALTMQVRDAKDLRVGDNIIPPANPAPLFPGETRTITCEWPRALPPGEYTFLVTAEGGNECKSDTSRIPFTFPIISTKPSVPDNTSTSTDPPPVSSTVKE